MACFGSAFSVYSDWVVPERLIHRQLGEYYAKTPGAARVIATPIALLSGIAKVFLFPVMCLVGMIAMPIIALIKACYGKKDAGAWLGAWCFCILGVAASAAFIGVSTYHISLVASAGTFVFLISVSIIAHVHLLVKEPPPPSAAV